MNILLSYQLKRIAQILIAKYTNQQMIDYIKYRIQTDPNWQKRALELLYEKQMQQRARTLNYEDRLPGVGFDREHSQQFIDCYENSKPLDGRLIQQLSKFAGQIYHKIIKNNPTSIEKLYAIMNKDINYLSIHNLRPQNFGTNNKQNLTETNKKLQLKKLINIIDSNPILPNNSFYTKTINFLNEIFKKCDMNVLKLCLDRYDYQELEKIINILVQQNWNYFDPKVRDSLQKNQNQTDYLPTFWRFNIFQFINNVRQKYNETK